MPYLKKIVECINEDLKASTVKGNPLQNSLLGGIARTVSITSTDDNGDITIKKPVEFKDGRVHTGLWGLWTGKGKFSNKDISCPLHLIFVWEGDKVVQEYRYFDPTALMEEVAASQKK